jgi:hypothetical protein
MPLQPPTRPHSAHPLNPSLFARSNASLTRPQPKRGFSLSAFGKAREVDWEDAWDSSSDREDGGPDDDDGARASPKASPVITSGATAPIPIKSTTATTGQAVSSSWASSFQHVSHPSSTSPHRPVLPSAKTYTNGAPPPQPGTVLPGTLGSGSDARSGGTAKLPPGGAWELVEPDDVTEKVVQEPVRKGKEAVRQDADDVLNGELGSRQDAQSCHAENPDPLQLLQSLDLSSSAPTTPSSSNPSSMFPFLPSTPADASSSQAPPTSGNSNSGGAASSSTLKTPKVGLGRQRSVRTERRREKFGRVLRGREGGSVEQGGLPVLSRRRELILSAELRRLAWSGVPDEVRPIVWQLLLVRVACPAQPDY